MIPFLLGSVLVSLTVGKPQNRTRTAHWPTKAGKCDPIASAVASKGLTDEAMSLKKNFPIYQIFSIFSIFEIYFLNDLFQKIQSGKFGFDSKFKNFLN